MKTRRKRILTPVAWLCVAAVWPDQPAWSQEREADLVTDAAQVLEEFSSLPMRSIPDKLLHNAQGVVVFPSMIKAGMGLGARHGRGVLLVRQDDSSFGNPLFVAMTGASVGWQFGVQASDLVLVFKTRRGVTSLLDGHKFTLGPDAGLALGPVGRQAEAATDPSLKSEIYAFARSRGLFFGITLEGSSLRLLRAANERFYGTPLESYSEVAARKEVPWSEKVTTLRRSLEPRLARVPAPEPLRR